MEKNVKTPKYKIRRGDTVKVITGSAKGKTGVVKSVDLEAAKIVVEGLNMVTKHTKPTASNPNGGVSKIEAPIHISNVMLVDSKGNATRVSRKADKDGKLVRISKKSGEVIKNG